MRTLHLLAALLLWAVTAAADTVWFSGSLGDSGNSALVASDLSAPLFGDDSEIVNNVALFSFSVNQSGDVRFLSTGFGLGGVDPYFSLFGSGGEFLASNFDQAFSTGGDFDLTFPLVPGSYTVALGAFANLSFAENGGAGTLLDGFIGLGGPAFLGNSFYEVEISGDGLVAVPEPSAISLMLLAGSVIWLRRGIRRRHVEY